MPAQMLRRKRNGWPVYSASRTHNTVEDMADEIDRSSCTTQSATVLEAMEETASLSDGQTRTLPDPRVDYTQIRLHQSGAIHLPESQPRSVFNANLLGFSQSVMVERHSIARRENPSRCRWQTYQTVIFCGGVVCSASLGEVLCRTPISVLHYVQSVWRITPRSSGDFQWGFLHALLGFNASGASMGVLQRRQHGKFRRRAICFWFGGVASSAVSIAQPTAGGSG